ncbi:hypothetical protein [Acuticoccus mangrovi]|uniref:Uncharacterized protein n=1 Tax=Acuticoccus mangrovi TaxID=2796142 RepID=A0A934IU58_9HYPH|nr:hypothetical protein [Acuticoccus mangrovi]MBJ3778658.1 hypothetical protein [Acuticoccus mangrovi]
MTTPARLARIARAQRALRRAAAADAQMADRRVAESEAHEEAIVAALNADSPLHGLLVGTMANALTRAARNTDGLRRQAHRAAAHYRREHLAGEVLEERVATAERAEAAVQERRRLERILAESCAVPRAPRRKPPTSDTQ